MAGGRLGLRRLLLYPTELRAPITFKPALVTLYQGAFPGQSFGGTGFSSHDQGSCEYPPELTGPRTGSQLERSMKRFSPVVYKIRAGLAEYFELFLTSAGVLLAITITLSELSRGEQGMALIFLIWLQGFIVWAVHRHCVLRNRALIQKMRLMVQDRVNNRLTVWLSLTDVQARIAAEAGREDRESVSLAAARAVSLELEKLSFESLRTWERRNARFLYSRIL